MKRVVCYNNKVLAVYAFSPTVVLVCSGAVCEVCVQCALVVGVGVICCRVECSLQCALVDVVGGVK